MHVVYKQKKKTVENFPTRTEIRQQIGQGELLTYKGVTRGYVTSLGTQRWIGTCNKSLINQRINTVSKEFLFCTVSLL